MIDMSVQLRVVEANAHSESEHDWSFECDKRSVISIVEGDTQDLLNCERHDWIYDLRDWSRENR